MYKQKGWFSVENQADFSHTHMYAWKLQFCGQK